MLKHEIKIQSHLRVSLVPIFFLLVFFTSSAARVMAFQDKDRLSFDELIKTDAVRSYALERYEESLAAFQSLLAQYPMDPAVRRYIGACLEHLGRSGEAALFFSGSDWTKSG